MLKGLKYVLLAAIVIFIWTFALVEVPATANPWTIFGMYSTVSGWSSAAYLITIGGAVLVLIMIGSLLVERFFCRYLCPLGAVFVPLSRLRLFRIKKPRDDCGACKFCTRNCPMGIQLCKTDTVTSGECIDCFACIETCPRGNVKANPTPSVAAATAVVAITRVNLCGESVQSGGASIFRNRVICAGN